MRRAVRWLCPMLALLLLLPGPGACADAASASQLRLSDRLRWVPAGAAAAYAAYRRDETGLWQLAGEMGATVLLTRGLKEALEDSAWGERPDGGGHAFPSGHASMACTGGAFLGQRYGWREAAPAYAVAAWVGYIRVEENRHHWRDVIGGCALAYGLSRLIVRPYADRDLSLAPWVDTDLVGLRVDLRWR